MKILNYLIILYNVCSQSIIVLNMVGMDIVLSVNRGFIWKMISVNKNAWKFQIVKNVMSKIIHNVKSVKRVFNYKKINVIFVALIKYVRNSLKNKHKRKYLKSIFVYGQFIIVLNAIRTNHGYVINVNMDINYQIINANHFHVHFLVFNATKMIIVLNV